MRHHRPGSPLQASMATPQPPYPGTESPSRFQRQSASPGIVRQSPVQVDLNDGHIAASAASTKPSEACPAPVRSGVVRPLPKPRRIAGDAGMPVVPLPVLELTERPLARPEPRVRVRGRGRPPHACVPVRSEPPIRLSGSSDCTIRKTQHRVILRTRTGCSQRFVRAVPPHEVRRVVRGQLPIRVFVEVARVEPRRSTTMTRT